MNRSQLVLVLAGHGYFGTTTLQPGDLILSDQGLVEPEGYGGSPCEVIHIEWAHGSYFGPAHVGVRTFARIRQTDVDGFRELVGQARRTPASQWVRELAARLSALGFALGDDFDEPRPSRMADIYRLVGHASSTLSEHPVLTDVSDTLGITARQVRRDIKKLIEEYGQPYDGWRDYVSDMRMEWTTQLLSIPQLRIADIAKMAGFRSDAALAHAFSMRKSLRPGELRKEILTRLG